MAPVGDSTEQQSRFVSPTQKIRKTELGIPGKVHIQRGSHILVAGKKIEPAQAGSTCLAAHVSFSFLPFIPRLIHNTPSESAKNEPKPHSHWQPRLDSSLQKICSVQLYRDLMEKIICDGAVIVLQLIYVMELNKDCIGSCYSWCPDLWVPDFAAFVAFCECVILSFQTRHGGYKKTFFLSSSSSLRWPSHEYQVIFLLFFRFSTFYSSSRDISMSCNLFSL